MTRVIHQEILQDISLLLTYAKLPFIFICDPISPRCTAQALSATLSTLSADIRFVSINAIECFTAKVLYDSVLNGLAQWVPMWEAGCANWPGTEDFQKKYSESFDAFVHGLRALKNANDKANDGEGKRMVIVVEQAERLSSSLEDILVPLTRLAEIARIDLSLVFVSATGWTDIQPSLGAAQDPFLIDIPAPSKDSTVEYMMNVFAECQQQEQLNAYHPALMPTYQQFAVILYDICTHFTKDPDELVYISAGRWPGFIQPVLDEYNKRAGDAQRHPFAAPPPETFMRLVSFFKDSFGAALEHLYPRLTDSEAWAEANQPNEDALVHAFPAYRTDGSPTRRKTAVTVSDPAASNDRYRELPRMSKFVLVAAYIASMNPAKSDLRMFGRGLDEKKRKRKRVVGNTKTKKQSDKPTKIPQRFLGPAVFPMDRMLAILGALLEDNDDITFQDEDFTIPGERTDMEVGRVAVYTTMTNLTSAQLLQQTSSADKIDGPPTFKCGISHEVAYRLAKDLKIVLKDLLWEA
ncbi:hypothetical protein CYLTODRAFT_416852 [Cylindrobasidium torrendii FP15055 ss-10]|uniref:Origin recognition complex subunit 5 n=1 Tax=Cylindrobasidium torrendii FP15055 ss-10 TaxID=1314674 RepID=A0A0D7BTH7_9AGAR|nr:hypothetical protein CYLTODRAFT_416852 [Cylindrobasidium torrendii FP15055 ss-10]